MQEEIHKKEKELANAAKHAMEAVKHEFGLELTLH
jgi:hypothetical protein